MLRLDCRATWVNGQGLLTQPHFEGLIILCMCLKFKVSETDSFFDIEANVNMLYAHVIWPKSGQVIDSSKTAQIPQVPKALTLPVFITVG